MSTWILVTDSRRARVFEAADKVSALTEVRDLLNAASHQQTPDERGRGVGSHTGTQRGMEPRTLPKEHDAQQFAREVSEFLRVEHAANHFGKLFVVAAPDWLGHLQAALHDSVRAVMQTPLQKNLVHSTPAELLDEIRALLKPH
jgi:protein required for attachment to host cells